MTEDSTQRPIQTAEQQLQRQQAQPSVGDMQQAQTQTQIQMAGAVACPQCGALNEGTALYCASCGAVLRTGICPNCGSNLDTDADFCEVCHHYVRPDICSFCGAHLTGQEAYCPECGSPQGGMVCPTCHTLNNFAFCKQCGQPLTDEARQLVAQLQQQPDYQELVQLARDYDELQLQLPYTSDRDQARDEAWQQLRERVLRLLAQDEGVPHPVVKPVVPNRMTREQLDAQKAGKLQRITELLNQMATPPSPSPAHVRNYAMAQKPAGVRLAWICNYKHAMHSSPCGCAKPQLGGKWVVLGHNSKQDIKDDK